MHPQVELKVVHEVNTASALMNDTDKFYSKHGKTIPGGKYKNEVWGIVTASVDPPMTRFQEGLDGSASSVSSDRGAKSRTVFNLIQHLPECIRGGNYSEDNVWFRGEV